MKRLMVFCIGLLLAACGGGGSSSNSDSNGDPDPNPTVGPGGLYLGFYQEDPANNPEDPTAGAIYLNLPAADSAFSGNMFFTYVGCQSSNVGAVTGAKSGTSLSGNWSGLVDNISRSGAFSGSYSSAQGFYSGTYTHAAGKEFVDLSPCIQYTIAANGTWQLFAVGQSVPDTFALNLSGNTVTWACPANSEVALVALLDAVVANAGSSDNAVLFQTIVAGNATSQALPALTSARSYIASVACFDAATRLAAGSKQFTAP